MAKAETDIVHRIMLEESKHGVVLHKNVRGMFLTLDGKQKIRAGLQCKGSGDLIGYTPTVITPDMVGKTVAIYTSIEVKTDTGKPSKEQLDFSERVRSRGGRAGIARSPEEARKI
jgi:hypothetical protein